MENVDNDPDIGRGIDRINASFFNDAGNRASGLNLEEIGMDGHGVANTLWRISAYLRMRADRREIPMPKNTSRRIDQVNVDGDKL